MEALLKEIRACTLCEKHLPLGPRPVLSAHANSKILIVGQAPGTKVHASGLPWDDVSGKNLRAWMDVDKDLFIILKFSELCRWDSVIPEGVREGIFLQGRSVLPNGILT